MIRGIGLNIDMHMMCVCTLLSVMCQVREAFVAQSSLTLPDFLRADKYAAVAAALAAHHTPPGRSGVVFGGGRIGMRIIAQHGWCWQYFHSLYIVNVNDK